MTEPNRPEADDANGLLEELNRMMERAAEILGHLRSLPPIPGESSDGVTELERQLDEARSDFEEVSLRLANAERQAGSLMSLYVATYQIHASLQPDEVSAAIAEVVRELLGAEIFVVLIEDPTVGDYEVAIASGLDPTDPGHFAGGRYRGGDPSVDSALECGRMQIGRQEGSQSLAVVPLLVEGATVGAIVVLRLLSQKRSIVEEDREMLDLLAAHAASALFAARTYARTDRKMRTLESLVKLARQTGEPEGRDQT